MVPNLSRDKYYLITYLTGSHKEKDIFGEAILTLKYGCSRIDERGINLIAIKEQIASVISICISDLICIAIQPFQTDVATGVQTFIFNCLQSGSVLAFTGESPKSCS